MFSPPPSAAVVGEELASPEAAVPLQEVERVLFFGVPGLLHPDAAALQQEALPAASVPRRVAGEVLLVGELGVAAQLRQEAGVALALAAQPPVLGMSAAGRQAVAEVRHCPVHR